MTDIDIRKLRPVIPQDWYRVRPEWDWTMKADCWLVYATGWSFMAWQNCKLRHVPYTPVMHVTTVGAKSGLLRSVVLPWHRLDEGLVVIGSNSGKGHDPGWVANLKANPRAWIRRNREEQTVVARLLEGKARDRALARVLETRPYATEYEERWELLGRQMPIMILEPDDAARSSQR